MTKILASIALAFCALFGGAAQAGTACNNTTITSVFAENGATPYFYALTALGHGFQIQVNTDMLRLQAAIATGAFTTMQNVTLYYSGTFSCATAGYRTDLVWISLIP